MYVTCGGVWVKLGGMQTPFAATRPSATRASVHQRAVALALGGLRFTAMTVVGMLAVWALVLIFG